MINKDLIKKYGKEAFLLGHELIDQEKEIIPISPALDTITGGVPSGSVVLLSGDSNCGKTITALHIAGNAQKLGWSVYFSDIERRLKSRDLCGIKSLDADKVNIIQSYKGKILTAEEHLSIVEDHIHNQTKAILILDSVSQLVTEKELIGTLDDQHYAPGPKLMAHFLRRISNVIPVNDIIIIAIVHLIASMKKFGKDKVRTGGRKIEYAADVDLNAKTFSIFKDKNDTPVGQTVKWQTNSTATNLAPGQSIESTIRYGIGIDEISEIICLGMDLGFIEKSGSWFCLKYLQPEDINIQGMENLYQYFVEHNDHYQQLYNETLKILSP